MSERGEFYWAGPLAREVFTIDVRPGEIFDIQPKPERCEYAPLPPPGLRIVEVR